MALGHRPFMRHPCQDRFHPWLRHFPRHRLWWHGEGEGQSAKEGRRVFYGTPNVKSTKHIRKTVGPGRRDFPTRAWGNRATVDSSIPGRLRARRACVRLELCRQHTVELGPKPKSSENEVQLFQKGIESNQYMYRRNAVLTSIKGRLASNQSVVCSDD